MHPNFKQTMYFEPLAWNHSKQRDQIVLGALRNGFPFSRILSASRSCVNALSFSSGDGRWLATGGDDLKLFLWDLHQDVLTEPSEMLRGHRGNIFCVEFSANNRFIFSGGIDDLIIQYDISQLDSPLAHQTRRINVTALHHHNDNIRGISGHPYKDEIFLSASSDGCVIRHDTRQPEANDHQHSYAKASDIIQLENEATDVKYHPVTENLFATSDSYGNVCLRDMRMAFGGYHQRSKKGGTVLNYATRLTRRVPGRVDLCHPEVSSIAFDREGEKLAVTFLYYRPTIYGLSDPYPLAICDGKYLPDGRPAKLSDGKYTNGCTIKHGSFGSAGLSSDQFYAAGSEDFRGYLWKVPSVSELAKRRTEIDLHDWETVDLPTGTHAFTASSLDTSPLQCVIPTPLDTPFYRLTGHKSIVNSVLIHPQLPIVASCGVEKNVLLHSVSPHAPGAGRAGLKRTSRKVRKIGGEYGTDASSEEDEDEAREREREARDRETYIRALGGNGPLDDEDGEDSEKMTIGMFDHILRQERNGDVFVLRKSLMLGDESSSDEEMSMSDGEDDTKMDEPDEDEEDALLDRIVGLRE